MRSKTAGYLAIVFIFISTYSKAQEFASLKTGAFNIEKDLLLAHFDCKTDVDDLQTVAALATLLAHAPYSEINYHAVAGTYGIQKGLYVPPNALFKLAFGDHWSDAHEQFENAVAQVKSIAISTLKNQGDIWIADAGQSDFSAELIKKLQEALPDTDLTNRIHVIQHSDWNADVTSPDRLAFVKSAVDYQKIPDGNGVGNGTPGFRDPNYSQWNEKISDSKLKAIWQLAIDLSNRYNGKEGRYHNEAISAGGLDFSDLSEVCWILGLQDIKDTAHFFDLFSK